MRLNIVAVASMICSYMCLAQTDSMFVEKMNGTIQRYSISQITRIRFGTPTSVSERNLIEKTLASFVLLQNYPNPFNPNTTIQYELPRAGRIQVNILDIGGRRVRSLSRADQTAGAHSLVWDSRTDRGDIVASGIYLCQLLFENSLLVKKMMLIK